MPTDTYQLGIDLGTTYTAAAVARGDQVKIVGLGNRADAIPSVIHLAGDGTILTGEAAARRAPSEPDRVAREFKRRIGDTTPLLLGGTPYSAEALTAQLLQSVVEKVTALEGGPPSHIVVTHPANWGPYKQDLLGQAIRMAGVSATTLTEPEAAAIAYASNERVEAGSTVAVYDLGGGTFDAAVLNKTHDGFTILGRPEGIERLGGIDFDEAVVQHVRTALNGALDQLNFDDPATMAALVRLRQECVEAKEALSADTETAIPVVLPGVQTDVRLTRGEFEQMVGPTLAATVDAMRRALESAQIEPHQITAVLLVGGSSRIPLVAQLVSDAFGRPVAVDAHPKHAIALGAAHCAAMEAQQHVAAPAAVDEAADEPVPLSTVIAMGSAGAVADAEPASVEDASGWLPAQNGTAQPLEIEEPVEDFPPWVGAEDNRGRRTRRMLWLAIAATLLLGGLIVVPGALASNDAPETDPANAAIGNSASEPAGDGTENAGAGEGDDDTGEAGDAGGGDAGDDGGDAGKDDGDGGGDNGGSAENNGGGNNGGSADNNGGGNNDGGGNDPGTTGDGGNEDPPGEEPPGEEPPGEEPPGEEPPGEEPPGEEPPGEDPSEPSASVDPSVSGDVVPVTSS